MRVIAWSRLRCNQVPEVVLIARSAKVLLMLRHKINNWCDIQGPTDDATTDLLPDSSPAASSGTDSLSGANRYRGFQSLDHILLQHDVLPLAMVLKYWCGILLVFDVFHRGKALDIDSGSRLVLHANLSRWFVRLPSSKRIAADRNQWALLSSINAIGIDDFYGRLHFYWNHHVALYPANQPLNNLSGFDRFAAPEVRSGSAVAESADVFLAANLALSMFAGAPVTVGSSDVPRVLDAIRLFRPDLPPQIHSSLQECLSTNPSARPATAAVAYEILASRIEGLLANYRRPTRSTVTTRGCVTETFSKSFSRGTGDKTPVSRKNEDTYLFRHVAPNISIAAVFDGVSTSDVASGAFASRIAKTAILNAIAQKQRSFRIPLARGSIVSVFDRLAGLSRRLIHQGNSAITERVVREFSAELSTDARTPQTTCTMALCLNDCIIITWIGDSPAYLATDCDVVPLTSPITAGYVAMSRKRHISAYSNCDNPDALADALGSVSNSIHNELSEHALDQVRLLQVPFRVDRRSLLILATDGLAKWLKLDPAAMLSHIHAAAAYALRTESEPHRAMRLCMSQLISTGLVDKCPDDVTVVIVELRPAVRTSITHRKNTNRVASAERRET